MTVTVDDLLPATKRSLRRRKLQLLMPEDLHTRIQAAAKERHMSMNGMLIELLSKIFPEAQEAQEAQKGQNGQ